MSTSDPSRARASPHGQYGQNGQASSQYNGFNGSNDAVPPAYTPWSEMESTALHIPHAGKDMRRRSTDSLRPSDTQTEQRQERQQRTLLLIFIHGFQGNERSFRSFPAHVHNVVTTLLAESHIVHTKIYPRYRSKQHITVARDAFSKWLAPHESPSTDVILFGHSMGGLLSADVVLKPASDGRGLQHRILGDVNFDVPFLGMHPGVIKTGLESLFQPAPEQPPDNPEATNYDFTSPYQSTSNLHATQSGQSASNGASAVQSANPLQSPDPNFNPKFDNDVYLPVRKGWKNALHFVNKHSGHLYSGTKQMVAAHVEFGGAMLDYKALNNRYARIRTLSEPQDDLRKSVSGGNFIPPRIRFVNYYTASTGRPKRSKSPKPEDGVASPDARSHSQLGLSESRPAAESEDVDHLKPGVGTSIRTSSAPNSPRISVTEDTGHGVIEKQMDDLDIGEPNHSRSQTPTPTSPAPHFDSSPTSPSVNRPHPTRPPPPTSVHSSRASVHSTTDSLAPTMSDATSQYTLSTAPSLSRNQTLETTTTQTDTSSIRSASTSTRGRDGKPEKPKKDRKFCMLPPKDAGGNRDPAWVRVHMKDVDEVAAHCGLFIESCPAYPGLVSDVAELVRSWVQDAEGERVARELDAEYEY